MFFACDVIILQIGVSLMVFQQFVGINGIGFYASETFVKAGMYVKPKYLALYQKS